MEQNSYFQVQRTRRSLRWLAWVVLAIASLVMANLVWVCFAIPDVKPLATENPQITSYMQHLGANQDPEQTPEPIQWTGIDAISPLMVCAIVKAEDTMFFRHSGIDWQQLLWVAKQVVRGRTDLGTSTIPQQLARNLYLAPEKTLHRKLREAVIARRFAQTLSKKRILEIYLNVIQWGNGIWGVTQASRHYFGKTPAELDLFDATFLVSLLASPRNELVRENRVRAFRVQDRVLWQLHLSGLVGRAEAGRMYQRINVLHYALQAGEPVLVALQRRPLALADGRPVAKALSIDQVIEEECGVARELQGQAGSAPSTTVTRNGTWTGHNANHHLLPSGSPLPPGAVGLGSGVLETCIHHPLLWQDNFAKLQNFTPEVWSPFKHLKVELEISPGVIGGQWSELYLYGDAGPSGKWYEQLSKSALPLTTGVNTFTFPLNFPGTIRHDEVLSSVFFVLNTELPGEGCLRIKNVRLETE